MHKKTTFLAIGVIVSYLGAFVTNAHAGESLHLSAIDALREEVEKLDDLIEDRIHEVEKVEAAKEKPPPPIVPKRQVSHAPEKPPEPIEREAPRAEQQIWKRVRTWGKYRFAFGGGRNRTFSFNDSDPDLADRDSHYLFGERLNNTFDPAIFSHYTLNVEADVNENLGLYTQIVADPWSYVGTTGEARISEAQGVDSVTVKLKYWGPNNSMVGEIYRADFRNIIAFPSIESKNGKTQSFTVNGVSDLGLSYDVPELEIDHEFRPFRKAWLDYKRRNWHGRLFLLADQNQVMTTDDPLGLSNTKDFWQPSPWTAKWQPIRRFADFGTPDVDGPIARGHYTDVEAFNAKDSNAEYLTLLRGAALEVDFGRSYIGGMLASPYGPWDDYQELNNIPGVLRIKHQVTPRWMVGSLYGFRMGLIDREPDAFNQVISLDTRYHFNPEASVYGQLAGSRDEIDRLSQGNRRSPDGFQSDAEGLAYRAGLEAEIDHGGGHSSLRGDFTWMDSDFRPHLSQYRALKADNFWGKHITFHEYSPDLEYFRIGTGVDVGQYVFRTTLRSSMMEERFYNLFDIRHVRSSDKNSFKENVLRDELTYQVNPKLKAKGFTRWVHLPKTVSDVEPYLTDFFFIDAFNLLEPTLENEFIDAGLDPSRFTIAGGLQYEFNDRWTAEASYTRTNDIPDFPRGLQNNVYLNNPVPDPEDPHILIDQIQYFLYHQYIYDLPPYDYFSIVKEKVVFKPRSDLELTFHAAQNSYKLWGPIDEMFNHQGLSLDYKMSDRVSLFIDYTHSVMGDIPKLIATNYLELDYRDHHNVYANLRYKIKPSMYLKVMFGVFGETVGSGFARPLNPFSVSELSLPTIDTEHLFRVCLEGTF